MKRYGGLLTAILSLTLIAACLTINVYFPAAAVQQAADQFVSDVQSSAPATPTPAATPEGQHSSWLIQEAYAQSETIRIDTPESQRLKAAMRGRVGDVAGWKSKGIVGENNKGYLEMRKSESLTLPERAQLKKLMEAENDDRKALYKEIMKANKYPSDKLSEIQSIFAKSWQEASQAGWWIQKPDGSWVQK